MNNLLTRDAILIVDSVEDWEDALTKACRPLLENGSIEKSYSDAIFESTKKNGPYYVLAPNIAMPHAGPKDGVNRPQLGLMVVREPFKFSEEGFEVRLVFTLAATDSTSHLETLQSLSELFADDSAIESLVTAKDVDEICSLLGIK